MSDSPWYRDGLRFECQRCGNCCTGASGSVSVSDAEIDALSAHLSLTPDEFRSVYTRPLRGGAISLRELRNGDCVFYDRAARGCRVHALRPRQCRTWPFWSAVVHSEERWREEARDCPGMDRGPLHPAEQITASAAADGTRPGTGRPLAGS